MKKATISGYFNPRHEGDNYKGLGINFGIEGAVADRVIEGLPEFLAAAGRNYDIKKVPAGVFDPMGGMDDDGNMVPAWREVENQYHLARSSDGSVVSPHTVTDQYAPLSLMDIAEEIQPWFDSGFVLPDGVYSTRGGARQRRHGQREDRFLADRLPEHFRGCCWDSCRVRHHSPRRQG